MEISSASNPARPIAEAELGETGRSQPASFEWVAARQRLRPALASGRHRPSYREVNAAADHLAQTAFPV
jgi:hypothetical protein